MKRHTGPYAHYRPAQQLLQPSLWRGLWALAGDWALVAACFALAIHAHHPLVYLLAGLLMARTQLALSVMMHEAAHGLLAPGRALNDGLGQALAAAPLWLSLRSYRAGHLKHHRQPMAQDDPVAMLFDLHGYPCSRARLAWRLAAYACGLGYVVTVAKLLRGDFRAALPPARKSRRMQWWEMASMLLVNGLMLGVLAWAGHPWLYLWLWLLPSVTVLPLLGQVRAIFEHGGLPWCADQSRNARSIARPSWQTFWFGPHGVHYHIEHHLFVRLPFYHLRQVHEQLAQQQLLPPDKVYRGYGAVLREVSRQAPQGKHI